MLTPEQCFHARNELRSMRAFCDFTGEDLRSLIEVPAHTRDELERFCAEFPEDADCIRFSLDYRDYMLSQLERQCQSPSKP